MVLLLNQIYMHFIFHNYMYLIREVQIPILTRGFERVTSAVYVWYDIMRSNLDQMFVDKPDKLAFRVYL